MEIAMNTRGTGDSGWTCEDDGQRERRRAALCQLDGLLAELEEYNLGSEAVPGRVRMALERYGVAAGPKSSAPELIEAIFEIQERFMLHPEQTSVLLGPGRTRGILEIHRRMAS